MLIQKTNPTGIDYAVQNLQSNLHRKLVKTWGLTDDTVYKSYGLCYRNKKDNGYIAEVYTGNDEYRDVYWDDTLTAISFFGRSEREKVDILNEVPVHLVFFVNLAKLKPAITHRADEEVRNDVQKAFGAGMYGFSLTSIDLWLENVLREYPGSYRDDRLKYVDMHPIHCFRMNFLLRYDIKNCSL